MKPGTGSVFTTPSRVAAVEAVTKYPIPLLRALPLPVVPLAKILALVVESTPSVSGCIG
jgi:hypothetical protein